MKKQEFLRFYIYSSLLSLQSIFIAWFPLKVLFEYTAMSTYVQQPTSLLDPTTTVFPHNGHLLLLSAETDRDPGMPWAHLLGAGELVLLSLVVW